MNASLQCIWIKTYGCQMNQRDSDTLAAGLRAKGYTIVSNENDADIALLNTCSVRALAESKAIGKAGRLLKKKKKNPNYRVGILGCMAARLGKQLLQTLPELDWIAPPQALAKIPDWIQETLQKPSCCGNVLSDAGNFDFRCYEQALLPSPVLSIPIQQGCSMKCSYCIVPKTRGPQQNRPFASIIQEIQQAALQGTREVILLGQIVNAYRDPEQGKSFVDLLTAIQNIEGIERIRFVSPHPAYFTDELLQGLGRLPKICPALHLPIQSGSNRMLQAMHRGYTREKILQLVRALRTLHPLISLSTDIIVGYPGETEEDFEQTYDLFQTVAFDMAYIFKYSPRPTTPSALLKDTTPTVDSRTQEARNQRLLSLLNETSTRYNQQFVHTKQTVLVEGSAHRGEQKWFGRNLYNKKVIFEGTPSLIGSFQTIRITKATASALEGTRES